MQVTREWDYGLLSDTSSVIYLQASMRPRHHDDCFARECSALPIPGFLTPVSMQTGVMLRQVPPDMQGGSFRIWDPAVHDARILRATDLPPPTQQFQLKVSPTCAHHHDRAAEQPHGK